MYFPKPAINENDLAIIERGDTAEHSIEAGQYVSWKGKLGKANAAILQGATLDDSLFSYDSSGALNNFTWEDVSWTDWINVTSNINTQYSWVKKRGKEICGCIYTPNNASIAAKGAIGTINSAYRPYNACTAQLVSAGTADNGAVWINGLTGIINVTNAVSGTCLFSFHYLTE